MFGIFLSVFEGPSDKWLIVSSNMAIIVNGVITLVLFYSKIYRNSVQRELFITEVCVLCSIIPTETTKKYNLIFF